MTAVTTLALRIHRVRCVDETGSNRLTELGEDDIDLGATKTDLAARSVGLVPFYKVGGFDDGDIKRFTPPRQLLTFNLGGERPFPRAYSASLVLVERDSGEQMGPFLEELARQERVQLRGAFTAFARANNREPSIAESVSVWRDSWELLVKPAVMARWRSVQRDDIFPPATVSIYVPSALQLSSPTTTLTFKGHGGTYEVTYDWELVS